LPAEPGKHFWQGNRACVEGALVAGCRLFAGYPITPATEISELMAERLPEVDGVFVQGEDELASLGIVVGASLAGWKDRHSTHARGGRWLPAAHLRFCGPPADRHGGAAGGLPRGEGQPLVGHRSIHASLIEGGKELSKYPERCVARFERRTLPGEDPSGIVDELDQLCRELAEEDPTFRHHIELDFTRHGYEVGREETVVQTLASAIRSVTGDEPEYRGSSGWLDSALLGEAGIPTVIFGPDGVGAHSAVEYVTLTSILTGARVLAESIIELCGE